MSPPPDLPGALRGAAVGPDGSPEPSARAPAGLHAQPRRGHGRAGVRRLRRVHGVVADSLKCAACGSRHSFHRLAASMLVAPGSCAPPVFFHLPHRDATHAAAAALPPPPPGHARGLPPVGARARAGAATPRAVVPRRAQRHPLPRWLARAGTPPRLDDFSVSAVPGSGGGSGSGSFGRKRFQTKLTRSRRHECWEIAPPPSRAVKSVDFGYVGFSVQTNPNTFGFCGNGYPGPIASIHFNQKRVKSVCTVDDPNPLPGILSGYVCFATCCLSSTFATTQTS